MSGKDFAKMQASARSKPGKKSSGSAGTVLAIVAIAILCFATGYWIGMSNGKPADNPISKSDVDDLKAQLDVKTAEVHTQQAKIETLQELVAEWKAKAEQGAHAKVSDLNFYQELPKQNVMPAPVEPTENPGISATALENRYTPPPSPDGEHATSHAPHAPTPSAQANGAYRIQIASFRSDGDAAGLQQKLVHAGFPALIQPVELGDRGTWYRVYAGPYGEKTDAETAATQIDSRLNLKGLIIRGD